MKNLITALTVLLLIASCSSPTAPDNEFEPYVVGNFKIVTPTEAEYIGEQSNQKVIHAEGDTVEIKQPGQRSLTLWQHKQDTLDGYEGSGYFNMQFVDSTVTNKDNREYGLGDVRYDNPQNSDGYPIGVNGRKMRYSDDRFVGTFSMYYKCGETYNQNNPIVFINFIKDNGSLFRVYAIHVDGIIKTVRDITKC